MNIMFLSSANFKTSKANNIYSDLVRTLSNSGNNVFVVTGGESNTKKGEEIIEGNCRIYEVVTGQLTKNKNMAKKAINILMLASRYKKAIKTHLNDEKIHLVLYATPPITLRSVIKYCKKKYKCKSYLMLKDIFPQNAVDIGILPKKGIKYFIYKYFRHIEKNLYKLSDRIGCMSMGNMHYLLRENKYLKAENVELFPNAIEISENNLIPSKDILNKYSIPLDKMLFIYGGNLGKPQGLSFLVECLFYVKDINNVHFIIVGNGSEKDKFVSAIENLENTTFINELNKEDYDNLCFACDVGMIFLDKRFTIPNYPSRILTYMQMSKPILACTDKNTDVKELIEEQAKCGKWLYSDCIDDFKNAIIWFIENEDKLSNLGENGNNYLIENFDIEKNIKKLESFVNL